MNTSSKDTLNEPLGSPAQTVAGFPKASMVTTELQDGYTAATAAAQSTKGLQ